MDKNLRSILTTLGIIFLYIFATIGIIKLFWNTDNDLIFEGRAKFLGYILAIFSFAYIMITGNMNNYEPWFYFLIGFHALYLLTGILAYNFISGD